MSAFRCSPGVLLAALVMLPLAAQAHPRYHVTVVGVANSVPNDINNRGDIAGNYPFSATSTRGFVNIGGTITPLGTLGGADSYASGINDHRVIVGTSINSDDYRRAFRLVLGGTMEDLGTLGGNNSAAAAINNRGDIVGSADVGEDAALDARAFLLRPGVSMQDLGRFEVPDNEGSSGALGINEYRQVVGGSVRGPYTPPESPFHAFLYACEEMKDLGTLGGQYSIARAINARGVVVGEASTGELHNNRAFLWYRGVMKNLGVLPNGDFSSAYDINDKGQVVGVALGSIPGSDVGYQVGFIWESGTMRNLNTLIKPGSGWLILTATGINNNGQIAAVGCRAGVCSAVRLDPTS